MKLRNIGLVAALALVMIAPAAADDQIAEPGITTPLLFTDGLAGQTPDGGASAASDFDILAGVIRAEVATAADGGTASATASVWADFMVGGDGDGELDAKVFANANWLGAWQADAAGAIATVSVTARLLELGDSEPILVAYQEVATSGVDETGCASCYGILTPVEGIATIEFDRALKKGTSYRLALQIDVATANPGDAPAFIDFLGDIPQADSAGVFASGVGVTVEDDADLEGSLAEIHEKLDALAMQLAAAVDQANERFDAVDAQLALNSQKIDDVAMDVAIVDGKVTVIDGKVTVIDGKIDVINGKLDAIAVDLDTIIAGIWDLQIVTCDLERLVMTPEGQRASDVQVCEDQPAFPYEWPERRLDHPGQGNGNNGSSGNNGNNGGSEESAEEPPADDTTKNPWRRGGRR